MKTPISIAWVIVCDASHARIFAVEGDNKPWGLVQQIEHPPGRKRAQELMADRPGRIQESAGLGRRSAMEPPTAPHEVEARRFAGKLAELLGRRLEEGAYNRLLVAAPPHFLGQLRSCLTEPVKRHLIAGIDHDYTWVAPQALAERLSTYL